MEKIWSDFFLVAFLVLPSVDCVVNFFLSWNIDGYFGTFYTTR